MSTTGSPKRKERENAEDKGGVKNPRRELAGEEGRYAVGNEWLRALVTNRAESFGVDVQPQKMPIFVAERGDRLIDVFKGMSDRNITAVPVLLKDAEKSFFGYLELADIVRYIVEHFGKAGERDVDYWQMLREESDFKDKTVNDVMKYPVTRKTQFLAVVRGYTAWAVVEPLGREPHVHRLAVVDRDTRQLYNLVTQGMVIRFIYDHLDKVGNVKNKPLYEVEGAICKVISVKTRSKAIDAFTQMVTKDIGSVAVVNEYDKLVGALSLRDIKLLSTDLKFFWRLHQEVGDFLMKMNEDWNIRHGRPARTVCLTPDSTLADAIRGLYAEKLHTIFIVNNKEEKKPVGIIRIKDIARELVTITD